MSNLAKGLAVCGGGAGIGLVASGFNPLGAVGGCLVATMATACAGPDEPDDPVDFCIVPETGKPVGEEGKAIYTDGQNYVVSDEAIEQEQADQYLGKIPIFTNNILNLFGVDSPWKNRIVLHLLNEENFSIHCPRESGGCAGGATFFAHVGECR